MASVTGLTAERMLEIEGASVVDGAVDSNGDLILTRHDGSVVAAGHVKGEPGDKGDKGDKGSAVDLSRPWSRTVGYVVGDVVGYAGQMWKAKSANLNKPPFFNTTVWGAITGNDTNEWVERDPNFFGDSWGDSVEIFWGGGTRTQGLTKVAGEFEQYQALKLTFGSNSNSWIYSQQENPVRGGEKIRIRVRAKLLAAANGTLIRGLVTQNTPDNNPGPFEPGYVSTEDPGGPQQLTTSWATYTFVITAVPDKPRGRSLVLVEAWANPANVVIDYIRVDRLPDEVAPVVKDYVAPKIIPTGVDLNTYATNGAYIQNLDAWAAAGTNYPQPQAGFLEVIADPNNTTHILQRYTPYGTNSIRVWQRARYNNVWSSWTDVGNRVVVHTPIASASNFNVAGSILTQIMANGKQRMNLDLQFTRVTSNYGVIPTNSWVNLGAVLPTTARFAFTKSLYTTGWVNALEGTLPISVYVDGASGNVMIKGTIGHTTTININHFFALNATVVEA